MQKYMLQRKAARFTVGGTNSASLSLSNRRYGRLAYAPLSRERESVELYRHSADLSLLLSDVQARRANAD